jgi:hypothetical protein
VQHVSLHINGIPVENQEFRSVKLKNLYEIFYSVLFQAVLITLYTRETQISFLVPAHLCKDTPINSMNLPLKRLKWIHCSYIAVKFFVRVPLKSKPKDIKYIKMKSNYVISHNAEFFLN